MSGQEGSRRLSRRRLVAMGAVALVAGASVVWLLFADAWRAPPPPPPPPVLELAGQKLRLGPDAVGEAMDLVRRYARAELRLRLPDGTVRALRPAELGAEIHRVRLAELVRAALAPQSALRRAFRARHGDDPGAVLRLPVPIEIDGAKAVAVLLDAKAASDQPASDAAIDVQKREVRPERSGFRLDVYATAALLQAALARGATELEAAAELLAPKVLAAQLGHVRFDQVLGYFETRYSRSARDRARTYNLRLAASRLDGTVLLPGQIFDFNETVGPRDEAHGYRVAPVIAQGELVDGIGGGTCQISGTLHGAAFFAGLDIVERYPHTRPSYYIKLGLDATVVYPTIDFRFRNPFEFPLVLHETVRDGVVRAEILGPERTRTVSFFRRLDEVAAFEEEIRETEELPEGTRTLVQRGMPGFKVTVYRVVRHGAYAVRTKRQDSYPPAAQIVSVGKGPKDRRARHQEDAHPEYVADEYLVITQGPQIQSAGATGPEPGGGAVESRVPGMTGRYGWQKRAGMKVYEQEAGEADKAEEEKDGKEG